MHCAGGVVIGIKQKRIFRDRRRISGDKFLEHEGLEKPGRMREMPFRWANIGHRLHDTVFRFKIARQQFGKIAHIAKTRAQRFHT
jgi:hypothetical protein